MNIREYLQNNNLSVYALSKNAGVPYSTVSDFVNGKKDIMKMELGIVVKIARQLNFSLKELIALSSEMIPTLTEGEIIVKNKKYFLNYRGEQKYLCKAVNEIAPYIKEYAECEIATIKEQEELKKEQQKWEKLIF